MSPSDGSSPDGGGFQVGDLVVGIVRQPDPVPCASCAVGEWDSAVTAGTPNRQLVFEVMKCIAPSGIVCLTGVSSGHRQLTVDMDALNRELVLENNVVFGTVNANRRHYEAAADALVRADRGWLKRLITRRVPLDRWVEAFVRQPHDVKTVIDFTREAGHCHSGSVL